MNHCKANLQYLTTDLRRDVYQCLKLDGMKKGDYAKARGISNECVDNRLTNCFKAIKEALGEPKEAPKVGGTHDYLADEIKQAKAGLAIRLNMLPFSQWSEVMV